MPIYMNVAGIAGESTNSQFPHWFEVLSYNWGETNAQSQGSSTGGGAGKVTLGSFNVSKRTGVGSPLLMVACARGELLPAVQLVVTLARNEGAIFEEFKLTDVIVSSYQTEGDWSSHPTESLSFVFEKLDFVQMIQAADGSVRTQSGVVSTGVGTN